MRFHDRFADRNDTNPHHEREAALVDVPGDDRLLSDFAEAEAFRAGAAGSSDALPF